MELEPQMFYNKWFGASTNVKVSPSKDFLYTIYSIHTYLVNVAPFHANIANMHSIAYKQFNILHSSHSKTVIAHNSVTIHSFHRSIADYQTYRIEGNRKTKDIRMDTSISTLSMIMVLFISRVVLRVNNSLICRVRSAASWPCDSLS